MSADRMSLRYFANCLDEQAIEAVEEGQPVRAGELIRTAIEFEHRQAQIDAAAFAPDTIGNKLPDWVKDELAKADRVKDALTLVLANEAPGGPTHTLAMDLAAMFRGAL